MRVLSPHAGYGIQLFGTGERVIPDASGYAVSVPVRKQIHAQFTNSGLLDHEADIALSAFDFSALPEGVNPLTRVGVFDTEAYCIDNYEEEKERKAMQAQIDQRFRDLWPKFTNQFIIVDEPVAPLPWPSYDEDPIEDILALQERIGVDPTVVRRYEEENQNRPEIIERMSGFEKEKAQQEFDVQG